MEHAFLEESHAPEHLVAYAEYFTQLHGENRNDSLWKRRYIALPTKYRILCNITNAYREAISVDDIPPGFQKWYGLTLTHILVAKSNPEEGHGPALVDILQSCGIDVSSLVCDRLKDFDALSAANLFLALQSASVDPSQSSFVACQKAALIKFWSSFSYFPELRSEQILALVDASLDLRFISLEDCLNKNFDGFSDMYGRVAKGGLWSRSQPYSWEPDWVTDYIKEVLVMLMVAFGNRHIQLMHGGGISKHFSTWATAVFALFITRSVGSEPAPPPNWSLKPAYVSHGCGECDTCNHIGVFMDDGDMQALTLSVDSETKIHLEQYFFGYDFVPYNLEAMANSDQKNTFTWMCTKEHKVWEKDHQKWDERRSAVEAFLKSTFSSGAVSLEEILGPKFGQVVVCRVEHVPRLEWQSTKKLRDAPQQPNQSLNSDQNRHTRRNGKPRFGSVERWV